MSKLLHLPQFWFGRLYIALHVGVIALVACFGDGTLMHKVVLASGPEGFWCILALAAVSAVAVADVVINDLLPARYALTAVKRHRHYVYIALAIGLTSLAFVIAKQVGLSTLHSSVALGVGGAAWIAFLDLYARHRES